MKLTDAILHVSWSPRTGKQFVQVQASTKPPNGRVLCVTSVEIAVNSKATLEEQVGKEGVADIERQLVDLCKAIVGRLP